MRALRVELERLRLLCAGTLQRERLKCELARTHQALWHGRLEAGAAGSEVAAPTPEPAADDADGGDQEQPDAKRQRLAVEVMMTPQEAARTNSVLPCGWRYVAATNAIPPV